MLNKKQIGNIIKSYRLKFNYTQQETSDETGILQSQMAKIERGALHIRFLDAMKLSDLFGIDWNYYNEKSKELKK